MTFSVHLCMVTKLFFCRFVLKLLNQKKNCHGSTKLQTQMWFLVRKQTLVLTAHSLQPSQHRIDVLRKTGYFLVRNHHRDTTDLLHETSSDKITLCSITDLQVKQRSKGTKLYLCVRCGLLIRSAAVTLEGWWPNLSLIVFNRNRWMHQK